MMQNVFEKIVELCESRYSSDLRTNAQLSEIKKLAKRNVNILTQILDDYIRQNEEDPTYRKNRLKGAKRMLNM
jgi:hypothetical protein